MECMGLTVKAQQSAAGIFVIQATDYYGAADARTPVVLRVHVDEVSKQMCVMPCRSICAIVENCWFKLTLYNACSVQPYAYASNFLSSTSIVHFPTYTRVDCCYIAGSLDIHATKSTVPADVCIQRAVRTFGYHARK